MASAKQKIKITKTVTKTRTKTRTKKNSSSGKKGNPNRCPTCGRFI